MKVEINPIKIIKDWRLRREARKLVEQAEALSADYLRRTGRDEVKSYRRKRGGGVTRG